MLFILAGLSYDLFMKARLPLSAMLSQAFVAFTIEFDNEFEHQVPHRTTNHGFTPGYARAPWLVSMAMWTRYMRYVPLEGVTAGQLGATLDISKKDLQMWLIRLGQWWSYLSFQPALERGSSKRLPAQTMVLPTSGGRKAIEVWSTLTPIIEQRWRERFGDKEVSTLKQTLQEIAGQLDSSLAQHLEVRKRKKISPTSQTKQNLSHDIALPELLERLLLAFASDFDQRSSAPLSACANVLRVLPDEGMRFRDLPQRTHLSADGVDAATRELLRGRWAVLQSANRSKALVPTATGRLARDQYATLDADVEEDWGARFGVALLKRLRTSLEDLCKKEASGESRLLRGIAPYSDGWRSAAPPLGGLPYFPMITHRGGFPDGS